MCLHTTQLKPIILDEDLIVYKELKIREGEKAGIFSPIRYYQWNLNELNETKITILPVGSTYDILASANVDYMRENDIKYITIGEGFHSFKSKDRCHELYVNTYFYLFKCLIPKSSEVYYDATGLVVSNQLIILEQLS